MIPRDEQVFVSSSLRCPLAATPPETTRDRHPVRAAAFGTDDAIPTETAPTTTGKKGCGSSFAVLPALVAVLSSAVIIRRKKD